DTLAGIPALASFLPDLLEAHGTLVEARAQRPNQSRDQALYCRKHELDLRRRELIQAIRHVLIAHIHLAREPEMRGRLRQIQQLLVPDDERSPTAERSHLLDRAEHLVTALDEHHRDLLRRIKILDCGTLLEIVDEWLASTAQLAELERDQPNPCTDPCTVVLAARNRWIQTVQAMRVAATLTGLHTPAGRRLWAALAEAEKRATQRDEPHKRDPAPALTSGAQSALH
ncbi:MAG: hypothetical protein AAGC55_14665, partial [Myxococcota bacterium]